LVLELRVLRFVDLSFIFAMIFYFDLDIFLFRCGQRCLVHLCSQFCY